MLENLALRVPVVLVTALVLALLGLPGCAQKTGSESADLAQDVPEAKSFDQTDGV